MDINIFRFSISRSKGDVIVANEIFRRAKSFSQFKKEMYANFATIENIDVLHAEYNYAVLVCEAILEYNRLIEQTKLFPYWKLEYIHDREYPMEISLLDGIILPSTAKAWNYIYPPNFMGDISYVKPLMAYEVKDVDHHVMTDRLNHFLITDFWKQCCSNGFGINRGIEELVKTENEHYLSLFK